MLLLGALGWSLLLVLESRFERFPDHPLMLIGIGMLVMVGTWLLCIGRLKSKAGTKSPSRF
jgi:hypothetical protein